MGTEGGPTNGNQTATGGEPIQPTEVEAEKQPPKLLPKKKREITQKIRSPTWKHFEKILNEQGKLVNVRCIYCAKIIVVDPIINDTLSIRYHMLICMKNPCPKESRQTF